MPVPLEGKGPKHQEYTGRSLSLSGLRAVTHGLGELQHLIPKDVPAASLKQYKLPGGLSQSHPFLSPRSRGPRARQGRLDLDFRDGGIAVSMVDPDMALTPEVGLKDVTVAMVSPPGAKLPIPRTVQHMEELGVLHANHGEEVLVPKVASEVVLVGQLLHLRRLQQAAVEWRLAHGLQVQQHHPTVEARESLRGRASNPGLGVLMAELPECVPGKGKREQT